MEIYFCLLIFTILTSFIKERKIQVTFISFILFLILALRKNNIGADLPNYIGTFNSIQKINIFKYDMEKGYLIFNKIISFFSTNERFFIIVVSFITTSFIVLYIKKKSKIVWLSFFLFITLGYYFMSFHIFRQFLAMGIMLISIDYIEKRELKKFLFLYFLAISFHYTAAIFILLYIVYPLKIDTKYILFLSGITVFDLLFSKKILELLFKMIPKYSNRYSDIMISGEGIPFFLLIVLVFILGLIFGKNKNKIEYHMISLAVFLQTLSINFSLFVRVVFFFSISMIIFIPNILYEQENIKLKYLGIISVVIGSTLLFFKILNDSSDLVPYLFYWQ